MSRERDNVPYRGWEYARVGDYHRNLDPNWSYTPTYLRKMAIVQGFIESLPPEMRILDAGCGEGVLVEMFRRKGLNIEGLDLNYESDLVQQGDIRNMPYPAASFDVVLLLDTLEHFSYEDQPKCLAEIERVLKPGGHLLISVPNLAHLNSRVNLLLLGRLDRTDIDTNHLGERPLSEYEQLLKNAGFLILDRVGVTFTIPWVYRRIICRHAARFRWLHDILEPLAKAFPSLAMLTIFVCKKGSEQPKHGRVGIAKRLKIIAQSRHERIFSTYTHLTEQERVLLFELAKSLPPHSTIVEIGSYLGASTCFLAGGARASGGKVYAIDTWTNIAMTEGERDTYHDFIRNTAPLENWIVPVRGLSTVAALKFNDKIDLLFVDGDHSYKAVRADLEAWLPKVKDGGIVVFHDYSWAEGVQRAIRELVVPLQIEGGRRLDSIYWTRISHDQKRKPSTIKASVIIATYGRSEYLRDAIASIIQQKFPSNQYEIIVVDNKPGGQARQLVKDLEQEWSRPIRYMEEPNIGLHNSRHAGAREALGKVLVYIDDDVIAPEGWLEALLKPFTDPQVASTGGKIIPKWESEPPAWVSQFGKGFLSLLDFGEHTKEMVRPQYPYGCNMAIRRSILYEVGGFNPDAIGDRRLIWLRGDGESGLYRKIHDMGFKVVYEPSAWIYHRIPASRLTPQYFYWRSFIQGISDSYTRVRVIGPSNLLFFSLLRHGITCFGRASLSYMNSIRYRDNSMQLRVSAQYWYGQGAHQLRTALSQKLRRHVLKDSYL